MSAQRASTPRRIMFALLLSGLLLGLGAGAAGCKRSGGTAKAVDAGPVVVGPENFVVAKKGTLQTGPRIAGSLEPKLQARVRSEVSGSVLQVNVDLGQQVKPGQVLARIEDRAIRNAFESAQATVQSAQEELKVSQRQVERTQALVGGGALAERDLETALSARTAAQARLAQARAQLAQAQKQLDAATVRSPMAGVVSERAINSGDVVAPGAALFTIIDPSSMRLTASVPSEAISALQLGKPVQFRVRGYPDQSFAGEIEHIAPAADPMTRQITVLVSIPNRGGKLIAGLFADGRIATESRQGISVPLTALDTRGGTPRVVRVKDGRAEQVEVKVGLRDDQAERVELISGVNPGDVLLVGAARDLAPGTPVTLSGAAPPRQG